VIVICASFIWEPGRSDAEFERLNAAIDAVANALPGFLGVDGWVARDGARRCVNYYWTDLETLAAFATHPAHLEAKRQYARWYRGYHVVVSEVLRAYGDGRLPHVTAGASGQAPHR